MIDKKDLRIIYLGTPDFAVPGLQILVKEGYHVVAVITAPDKPAGRGLTLQYSDVKKAALELNIPVLQPEKLKDPDFIAELKSYHANLQIVVAFRMLPEAVWNMPAIGTFNLHGSLLPQYRGAAPINWAIINGENETGLTTFFLKHEIDTGDMMLQVKEPILEEDTFEILYNRLKNIGATLIHNTVQLIEMGGYQTIPQDTSVLLKAAPKLFKETCQIDWNKTEEEVYNFVRGLSPYPCAWTVLNEKTYKVIQVKKTQTNADNTKHPLGSVVQEDSKAYVYCQSGKIELIEIQAEGKKRMKVLDYLRGNKI
ncbi:MAG: methionyl-tRNA formyltransferase [Cytophagaceae bacterium]|nr:methionyl-tRNA formyltransferase [Cytophagaceae bacterium]